jgi:hypothetical protein
MRTLALMIMIGEQAIELIDIGLLSMQMNATSQAFIDACFNFPSLAELFKYATYDAMRGKQQGRAQGSIAELPPLQLRHGRAAESTEGTTPADAPPPR